MKEELIKRMIEEEKWARSVRRKYANWEFINKQPPRIKAALIYLIETGDFREAARIAKMNIEEFMYLAKYKANIYSCP